jgi:peptide/nickel transport system substrate-binding protein
MKKSTSIRVSVGAVSVALLLSGCTQSSDSGSGSKGGTLYILSQADQILHLDPQRNYTGEDLAFASGYLNRTLTQYTMSQDNAEASKLVADLATDVGKPTDDSKTWAFTLRDGVKWQDGKPVTCADVAYGVSRTFATDIITDGPVYAIQMLDIPKNGDGSSKYPGPYRATPSQQALFDNAVTCNGNKISFHLSNPSGDFNYAVTLSAFAPVRKDKDTGEKYDDTVLSTGPYKIQSYKKKSKLILVRNPYWSNDELRPAYPDVIEYDFSVPALAITQRLMADAGNDTQAVSPSNVEATQLKVVFSDDRYKDRRLDEYDPYAYYLAINTQKVPNVKHRQAILAAMNRAELLVINGGTFAGELADGFIKPNIGQDYAPTNLWGGLLGDDIAPEGNVDLAKKLIEESGEPFPNPLVFDYSQSSDTADKVAASIVASLARAGIKVTPNPLEPGGYYGFVLDDAKQGGMSGSGWAPDWANASTVIPELFSGSGGFNLSQYDDPKFNADVQKAKGLSNRDDQAKAWQRLNARAAELGLAVPTRFGREQRIQGSKVHGSYIWGPYGSYPYGALSVSQ